MHPLTRVLVRCALFCVVALVAAADPVSVLIRVPTGTAVPASLRDLLGQWRRSGQVTQVLYLTDGRPEKPGRPAQFAALAVLEFASEAACRTWEKSGASALPATLVARRADVLAHGELALTNEDAAVFVVNTYTPLVPAARFAEYVQGYVKPLYEAMRGTKHLVRYTAYLEHGETGQAMAFNVLEYRDATAFAAMGTLKGGIRERLLATHPTYPQFDKIKDTLRIDGFGTFATYTELPPADVAATPRAKQD